MYAKQKLAVYLKKSVSSNIMSVKKYLSIKYGITNGKVNTLWQQQIIISAFLIFPFQWIDANLR
jgi:hypothetical protein